MDRAVKLKKTIALIPKRDWEGLVRYLSGVYASFEACLVVNTPLAQNADVIRPDGRWIICFPFPQIIL